MRDHLNRGLLQFELERGGGLLRRLRDRSGSIRESLLTHVLNRLGRSRDPREEPLNRKLTSVKRDNTRDTIRNQFCLSRSDGILCRLIRNLSRRGTSARSALEALIGIRVYKLRPNRFIHQIGGTLCLLGFLLDIQQLAGKKHLLLSQLVNLLLDIRLRGFALLNGFLHARDRGVNLGKSLKSGIDFFCCHISVPLIVRTFRR